MLHKKYPPTNTFTITVILFVDYKQQVIIFNAKRIKLKFYHKLASGEPINRLKKSTFTIYVTASKTLLGTFEWIKLLIWNLAASCIWFSSILHKKYTVFNWSLMAELRCSNSLTTSILKFPFVSNSLFYIDILLQSLFCGW